MRTERHEAAPRTPRGDTDLPMSDAEISDKFHLFADPILGSKTAQTIEDLCSKFDQFGRDWGTKSIGYHSG